MTCPICGGKTGVYGSYSDVEAVYRRRKCLDPNCNHRFYTTELESGGLDFYRLEAERVSKYRKKNNICKSHC